MAEATADEANKLDELSLEAEREALRVRKKEAAAASTSNAPATTAGQQQQQQPRRRSKFWPPTADQLLMLSVVASLLLAMLFVSRQEEPAQTRMFTKEQLQRYDGKDGRPMYLAILGQVYDVTKGKQHYGQGGGYSFFVGRDASRAFVTGEFQAELTDDVEGLTNEQFASLGEWTKFYHKEYLYKGRLIGAFYNAAGNATAMLRKVQLGAKAAKTNEELKRESEARFPRCNVRWNDAEGGWVSCEGENLRPRKIFIQLPGGKPAERCACMEGIGWSDVRQVYPDCAPEAQKCQVSPPS